MSEQSGNDESKDVEGQGLGLCGLPEELILSVLSWLNPTSLVAASATCARLHRLANEDEERFWAVHLRTLWQDKWLPSLGRRRWWLCDDTAHTFGTSTSTSTHTSTSTSSSSFASSHTSTTTSTHTSTTSTRDGHPGSVRTTLPLPARCCETPDFTLVEELSFLESYKASVADATRRGLVGADMTGYAWSIQFPDGTPPASHPIFRTVNPHCLFEG